MAKTYAELLREERERREEEERKREAQLRGATAEQAKIESALAGNSGTSGAGTGSGSNVKKNNGNVLGGLGYLGSSFGMGAVRGVEGIWDYTAGGLASIFGGKAGKSWAEQQMTDDWFNYNSAAERYNPGTGWKLAGDVLGGVGQSVLAIGVGAVATLATGGGAAPAIIGGAVAGLSAAGTATSEAVKDPNADKAGLDYKDWLYGTGAGALEAGIEAATGGLGGALGKTVGEMGSEVAEAITKKAVKNTLTSSVGKDLIKEMAGEGIEEGLSAFIEPYIKQATYDKDAENATIGDITYSALVGALAGGATMGGVNLTTSTIRGVDSLSRGSAIAKDSNKTADLLKNASLISGYESERETGSEVFEAVMQQYEKVKNSLESTGGVAQTMEQKKMLGELDRYVSAAVMQPGIVNAAKGVALNADSYAESLNAFYQKTNAGKTVTAADLTAGLKMDGTSKEFVKSVNKAMRTNSVLREVVVNNTLGRMEMDAQAYADSIYGDTRISSIATQENINRFVESANADTLSGVNKALGVDMRSTTPEAMAFALKRFRDSGGAAPYEESYRDVEAAKRVQSAERRTQSAEGSGDVETDTRTGYSDIETLERMLESAEGRTQSAEFSGADGGLQEGATRFVDGESDFAIIKRGDSYRIYDYKTEQVTRKLSLSELRDVVRNMRGGERPTIEVIGKVLEGENVNPEAEIQNPELLQNVERVAEEKIPEYKKLTETERESVRETVRRAMLNGVSEEDAALFGRISAKSGMKIVVAPGATTSAEGRTQSAERRTQRAELDDAWYDGKNTVYVDANADRARVFSGLLGHEMWHKMFKSGKARRIMMQAYNKLDKAERAKVEKDYTADSEKRGFDKKKTKEVNREEVAAAYAEELFNDPEVWDFVLSEEASLADRTLKFFEKAEKRYSFAEGMPKAARKWLAKYKMLFDQVATYNKGRGAAENATPSDTVRKIERIGRIIESAEFRTQNAELDDGSRAALAKDSKGREYWQIDSGKDIFKGLTTPEEYRDAAYKFLISNRDNKITVKDNSGKEIIFIRLSAEEFTHSQESQTLFDTNPGMFSQKMRLIPSLEDLLLHSNVNWQSPDHKKHKLFKEKGFENYRGRVGIDNVIFNAIVRVGKARFGDVFYDINLEVDSYLPRTSYSASDINESTSNNSISQTTQKNNISAKKTSKKVDDGSRSALKKSDKEYRDEVKAKANEKVKKARAEANAYAKEKIAEAKEAFENKAWSLEGRAHDAERKAELAAAWFGFEEREGLIKVLKKETKSEDERISLARYTDQLRLLSDTIGERALLVEEYEQNRAKLKNAETKKEKAQIRRAMSSLEERIELIENVISRRDSELFEISAMQPIRELVQRAYKLGKSEGATTKVSAGIIKKRLAQMMHSKSFSHKEAREIIDRIATRFAIDDFSIKSQWSSRLWEMLNETDDRASQKKAINAFAEEAGRYLYKKRMKGKSAAAILVKRVQKYKHRLVFTEFERNNLKKYYTSEFDNIMSIWEYDGNKDVTPKRLSDILWDAGQVREYSHFAAMEDASPSDRSDTFYELLNEFEQHEEHIDEITADAKSAKQEIVDMLWEGFENGGRETYKAKYDYEVGARKLYRTLERRIAAFADLEGGRFKNATEGGGALFTGTLDQIPKILYKGSFYPGRARKVLAGLNEWYKTDNNMLGYVDENNAGLFRKDIKSLLEALQKKEGEDPKFTYEEMQMLDQVLQYFYSFVEHFNKVFRKNMWVDALPLGERFLGNAQKQEATRPMYLEKIFKNRYVKGFGDTESVIKLCDGYEDGIFSDTFYGIRDGLIDAQVLEMEVREEFDAFLNSKKNKKFIDSLYEKTVEINGAEVPRIALIGYYLTLQREHARAGLAYSGFKVAGTDGKKLISVDGFAKGFEYVYDENKSFAENKAEEMRIINNRAEKEIDRVRGMLTTKEREYVSLIEAVFATCKGIKEEADYIMFGYSNCADGYYYPIRRYATGMGATLDVYSDMSGVDRFTNASFNKETVKGAKQALYIEDPAAVLSRHVKNLTLYAKVSPVVDNFNRLWNLDVANNANNPMSLKTFYDSSERAWKIGGKVVGFEYLQGIIKDIMSGGRKDLGFLGDFMSKVRGSYATFALGGVALGNPKVLLTQLSSLVSSAAILDTSSVIGNVTVSGRDVDKYCPLAKLRNKDDSAVRAQTVVDKLSEKQKKWTVGISFMDRQVIKRLFAACQLEAKKTKGFALGTEANKIEAGKILYNVILGTQQNALITERTESMRSGSEFARSLSMFRGDSIKNFGRLIDASGEIFYLKAQLSAAKGEERVTYEKRLKEANKKFGKSLGSILANAAVLVGIGHLFEWALAKEDDEEKPWWSEVIVDYVGNLLGGLPFISQAYSKIFEGYDLEGTEYSMFNDLINTVENIFDLLIKGIEGKLTWSEILGDFEKTCDSIGQIVGIPTRNIRNFAVGITKRINPETGYRVEDVFKSKAYASDLENAIENGDDDLALTIIELATDERLGSGLSEESIAELGRLAKLGEKVLPSAVGDTVTIDGEERELSGSELKAVREIYAEAVERVNVFVNGDFYKGLSDEQKASAVRKIYTLYKDLGYDSILGTERDEKALVLSKIVDGDALVAWDACSVLKSDKDEDGKTVSGSLKKKVIDAIWELDIPEVQRVLLIAMRGYKFDDDDIPGVSGYAAVTALYSYIESLEGLSDEERLDLFEASGFAIKDGAAEEPVYEEKRSTSGGSKIVKIGRVTGGTMRGTMKGSVKGSVSGKDYSRKIERIGKVIGINEDKFE